MSQHPARAPQPESKSVALLDHPEVLNVSGCTSEGWRDSADGDTRARQCCEHLERGGILAFADTAFAMPPGDRDFLRGIRQTGSGFFKNVSYRPLEDRVTGFARGTTDSARLLGVMREYSRRVTAFAAAILVPYAAAWKLDHASYRPLEERGRELPEQARNDLIHIDSFPTRPTNGARILRVFTNINASEPRAWTTTENFETLARRYANAAGLAQAGRRWQITDLLGWLSRSVGLARRSRYDRFMLRFHDYLKSNREFQRDCPKWRFDFVAGSTWMAFTDVVPHSVLAGRFALEHTYIVPCAAMLIPGIAPLGILERLAGAPLTLRAGA